MNLFLSALFGGLVQVAGSLVGRVLLSLGISYLVYTGVDAALSGMKQQAFAALSSATSFAPQLSAFVGVLQIGTCLNIIFSAWAARLALAGMTSGTIKKMVVK